ncbi:hypothetical protein DGWBC_1428 [Dehalogenimonas sp. WBC-2]|nr:hypothetical protein DGWBC_1428 [Dehalogenimonas sp. WBC-2]
MDAAAVNQQFSYDDGLSVIFSSYNFYSEQRKQPHIPKSANFGKPGNQHTHVYHSDCEVRGALL